MSDKQSQGSNGGRILRSQSKSQSKSQPKQQKDSPKQTDKSQPSSKPKQGRRMLDQNNKRQRIVNSSNKNSGQMTPQDYQLRESQSIQSNQYQATFWGTNISIDEVELKIENFIKTYQSGGMMEIDEMDHQNQNEYVYLEELDQIRASDIYQLIIDGEHLFQYDKLLYHQLINYPGELIPIFDKIVNNLYNERFDISAEDQQSKYIQIGLKNLRQTSQIRQLVPKDINRLIQFSGIVTRCSEIIPEMKDGYFRCQQCHYSEIVSVERGRIQEPDFCKNCRKQFSFELVHNRSIFIDKQLIKLQENPSNIPDGETPLTLQMLSYENNVDFVRPGDKVTVIGIYRASGQRISQKVRTQRSVFRTHIDVVSYKLQKQEGDVQSDQEVFSEQQKQQFVELSKDPNLYEMLINSLAPSIFENQDVKKGLLCQLFGGSYKEFSQSTKGRFRQEINCLLVGDPSTAKSQLLQYVHKIANRGIYTSGKGSSAVGLTAYVTTDQETKELVLESGALVLSDKGICCIDEFDKMDENTRSILHEAMEQQTISVAKAGIVCQLNARTAILASANPVDSRYNIRKSVTENINLGPTLLSRFDLIYLMLDVQNSKQDERLAQHILSLYSPQQQQRISQSQQPIIAKQLLSQYINYCRQNVNPELTVESSQQLVDGYLQLRKQGLTSKTISATTRQLESLIRISESLAKMRLSQTVSVQDVFESIRLMKVATQQAATDPTTGQIDMNIIVTGVSEGRRQLIFKVAEKIRQYILDNRDQIEARGISNITLMEEITTSVQGAGQKEFEEAIDQMVEDNVITKHEGQNRKRYIIRPGTGIHLQT